MTNLPQLSVLTFPVHLANDYTQWLTERLRQGVSTHVVTLNAEMVMLAEQNPALAEVIRAAELVIPDGAGITLHLRLKRQRQKRCPGIELAASLLKNLQQELVCFYGGKPGVAQAAAQSWQKQLPHLNIIASHGYLSPPEQQQWKQTLAEHQPRVILVGLGVPQQELWIFQNRSLCPQAIWIGVGGSFDIWAGVKTRAPKWLRENSLEWLYRLYQEPWRWKRMLALPQFFLKSLFSK
ncbi:MAG: WecB/TagA/CpsF family glycosyltransferase [Cyanophyceae cyanobacterium]